MKVGVLLKLDIPLKLFIFKRFKKYSLTKLLKTRTVESYFGDLHPEEKREGKRTHCCILNVWKRAIISNYCYFN